MVSAATVWEIAIDKAVSDPPQIVGHYIDGTRLRFRQITGAGPMLYKLAHKVRRNENDPSVVMLANSWSVSKTSSRYRRSRVGGENRPRVAGLPGWSQKAPPMAASREGPWQAWAMTDYGPALLVRADVAL